LISTIMMRCCRCCFSIVRNTWPHIRPDRGRLMKGAFWPRKVNSYKDFMDLDVTVLKAAMIKILQTSTFFPAVAEIRSIAEAMVNFYNKTTLPTAGEAWEEVQRHVRRIGPYSSQPWEFSCPKVERAAKQFGIMELCRLQENEVNTARAQFMRIYDRQQEKMKMEREIAAISAQCLPL